MDCTDETNFALLQTEPNALGATLGEPEFRDVNSMRKTALSLDVEFGCECLSSGPTADGFDLAG